MRYCKVGSLSKNRPLCWCQRFAGYVNDPHWVGAFWGRPLGKPIRGVRCEVAFPGTSTVCLGSSTVPLRSLEGPYPAQMPGDLPAWPSNLSACMTWREVVACLGRAFPSRGISGGLAACLGGSTIIREGGNWLSYCWVASFPRGKVSTCLGGWRSC